MRKIKYLAIGLSGGIGFVSIPVGVISAIYIPKMSKLKNSLGNFVLDTKYNPYEDPKNVWKQNKRIKYLALGDSLSSGFNGTLGMRESLSFPIFLANNLKNANKLASYKDLSHSASTIWSTYKKVSNNLKNMHVLKEKADLITISIGSNDLLAALKILNISIPFDEIKFPFKFSGLEKIFDRMFNLNNDVNRERELLNINEGLKSHKEIYGEFPNVGKPHQPLNDGEVKAVFKSSVKNFVNLYKTKDWHNLFTIDEALVNKDRIFKFITKNLAMLFSDIHNINPKAKIIFVAPHNPFSLFPDSVIHSKGEKTKKSYVDFYEKLVDSMKRACEINLSGKNHIVDFIKTSDLISEKNIKNVFDKDFTNENAFNNILDIHPSIYGNKLVADGIFNNISPHLQLNDDLEKYHTKTYPYDHDVENEKKWARIDEDPKKLMVGLQKAIFNFLKGEGNLFIEILDEIKNNISVDYHKTNIQNLIEIFKDAEYDDYISIVEIFSNNLIIDIVFKLLKDKEVQSLLIDFLKTLKKVAESYENAAWGSKTFRLSTWSPTILSKGKKLIEKVDLFKLLPDKDKISLRKSIDDSVEEFYKKTNNKEATNFIEETFKLFTEMKISNSLNWKQKFFPESGSFSLLENMLQLFS